MSFGEIIAFIGVCITLGAYIPYFYGTFRGTLKPHGFSWFVWSMLTATACAAQIWGGGGAGAWIMGVTACGDLAIALLSLRYGEKNITRSDWVTFVIGLSAVPLWIVTDSPFWSVTILAFADTIGTWPSVRKTWHRPHAESAVFFILAFLKHCLAIIAMAHVNWITSFYPFVLIATNLSFVLIILMRRRRMANSA